MSGLVKDIVERPSAVASSSKAPVSPNPPSLSQSNGFPTVTHRSLKPPSAFVKARQERERLAKLEASGQLRQDGKPPVIQTADEVAAGPVDMDEKQNLDKVMAMSPEEREQEKDELLERFGGNLVTLMQKRRQARQGKDKVVDLADTTQSTSPQPSGEIDEAQNAARVEAMSAEEREQEKAELFERFGGNLTDIMKRRQEARHNKLKAGGSKITPTELPQSPPRMLETPERRQVRFAEDTTPQSVPKIDPSEPLPDEDEDPFSPGNIHRTYFPTTTHDSSKLEWIQAPSKPSSEDKTVRFDLSGQALDAAQAAKLPSHLGLHHHGSSPDLAGYTLKDIYHLCLSTVPSQRITMYDVLAKIVARYMLGELSEEAKAECAAEHVNSKAIELATGVLAGLEKNANVIRVAAGLLYEAIGGSLWGHEDWLDTTASARYPSFVLHEPGQTEDWVAKVPFDALLSRFTRLLALNQPDISALTTHHIIRILRRVAIHSLAAAETICPLIPVAVSTHLMGTTNPQLDARPSIEALHLLLDITVSARACAEALMAQNIYEPLLRFVASYISELSVHDQDQRLRQQLCIGVLRVFTALGRYGLMASITVTGAEIWRDLGALVTRSSSELSRTDAEEIAGAYMDACTVWITCAVDPHRIVPEHDVTWTQVTAMGWSEEALDILEANLPWSYRSSVTVSALRMVGAWLRGSRINEPLSGAAQKDLVRQRSGLFTAMKEAVLAQDVLLATASIQLLSAVDGSLDDKSIRALMSRYNTLIVRDEPSSRKDNTLLAAAILNAQHHQEDINPLWAEQAARLMLHFTPGDEPVALDLLDKILRRDGLKEGLAAKTEAIGYKDGLLLLRPLLQHTILPDVNNLVGPVNANPVYLKSTSTLRHPYTLERRVLPAEQSNGPPAPVVGLPLPRDWVYSPLNELLQSGTSQSLSQVPPGWDASEVEITHATLVFAELHPMSLDEGRDRSLLLLNLMKVFMLEHGQQNSPNPHDSEIFRDSAVSVALQSNIAPLMVRNSDTHISHASTTMEQASLPFLGAGVPFFQFFVDFLALFEAISLSDTTFTQLVVPPLSQLYPVDFRKHIWCDQPTSLRSMRLSLVDIPVETDLNDYFYPQETHADALAGYTRSLINRWVTKSTHPFMYLLAVHHLSATLWTPTDEASVRDSLMKAVFMSAPVAVLQDLLKYEPKAQIAEDSYEATSTQQVQRKEIATRITGNSNAQRLDL